MTESDILIKFLKFLICMFEKLFCFNFKSDFYWEINSSCHTEICLVLKYENWYTGLKEAE